MRDHLWPVGLAVVLLAFFAGALFLTLHQPPPEQRAFTPEYACYSIGRGAAQLCERQNTTAAKSAEPRD